MQLGQLNEFTTIIGISNKTSNLRGIYKKLPKQREPFTLNYFEFGKRNGIGVRFAFESLKLFSCRILRNGINLVYIYIVIALNFIRCILI